MVPTPTLPNTACKRRNTSMLGKYKMQSMYSVRIMLNTLPIKPSTAEKISRREHRSINNDSLTPQQKLD